MPYEEAIIKCKKNNPVESSVYIHHAQQHEYNREKTHRPNAQKSIAIITAHMHLICVLVWLGFYSFPQCVEFVQGYHQSKSSQGTGHFILSSKNTAISFFIVSIL